MDAEENTDEQLITNFGGQALQMPTLPTSDTSIILENDILAMEGNETADMVDFDIYQHGDLERNVDFSIFIQQWYFESGTTVPSHADVLEVITQVGSWMRPKTIVKADLDGDRYDLQGINWARMGLTRAAARRIRARTYSNYTNITPRAMVLRNLPPQTKGDNFFAFRQMDTKSISHLSHFQLRNLMCCGSGSDIYYAGKNKIFHMVPGTDLNRTVMDLSKPKGDSPSFQEGWKSSTMTAKHGVLLVGGFNGEYAMLGLDSSLGTKHVQGTVTTDDNAITNYIHTYRSRTNSHPTAALCSNDKKIRILDCYTNTFTAEFEYQWAVNCTAISPCGRLRVIVGDDRDVTIANAETGTILQSLSGHMDYGFACDWADDGIHVATANQDRQIRVYDARNWSRPVSCLMTDIAGARALRFSPVGSGRRLLVAAEPADVVHVIDATSYKTEHRLDMFGEICGISFNPDGQRLYVANADDIVGGIVEFERVGQCNPRHARSQRHRAGTSRSGAANKRSDHDVWQDDDADVNYTCDSEDWIPDEQLEFDERVVLDPIRRRRKALHLSQLIV